MQILIWLFVLAVIVVDGGNSDIECLKSIKETLEDPENLLTSWRFDNLTEGFICKFYGVECWHASESKVLNIHLSDMGLVGWFPRGLRNCTSLVGLDLSHNHLSGPLPSDISAVIRFIVYLDVSNNYLSGEIPASIANCAFLNNLNLDNNQLEGRIPADLGGHSRLKRLSVAINHLSGPVPDFPNASYYIFANYSNNNGLCGGPLPPCIEEDNGVKKIKFISGFAVGWAISAPVTFFLGLFYLPDKCLPCQHRPIQSVRRLLPTPWA